MTAEDIKKEEAVKSIIENRKDIRGIYCVYDIVARNVSSPLFYANNDEAAKRAFMQIIQDDKNYPVPSDFALYRVGYIDLVESEIVSGRSLLMSGASIVEVKNE